MAEAQNAARQRDPVRAPSIGAQSTADQPTPQLGGAQGSAPEPRPDQDRPTVQATIDLVRQLERARPQLETSDPKLASQIDRFARSFYDQSPRTLIDNPRFVTDLAYALQDVEKRVGPLPVEQALRDTLTRSAATSPGLQNEQLQRLVAATPTIDDADLVQRIRDKGAEIAPKADQNTPTIREDVYALTNAVLDARQARPPTGLSAIADRRIASEQNAKLPEPPSAPTTSPTASEQPAQTSPSTHPGEAVIEKGRAVGAATSPDATGKPGAPTANPGAGLAKTPQEQIDAFGPDPAAANKAATTSQAPATTASTTAASQPPGAASSAPASTANQNNQKQPGATQAATPAENSGETKKALPENPGAEKANKEEKAEKDEKEEKNATAVVKQNNIQTAAAKGFGAVGSGFNHIARILDAVKKTPAYEQVQVAALQPTQAEKADTEFRLAAFAAKRADTAQGSAQLNATHASAANVINAIDELKKTAGAQILNRINDAAANNAGGIRAVIDGLKPGGAFEDLRKDLNLALVDNNEFGAAHTKVIEALKQYGTDRAASEPILGNHPDAAKWKPHLDILDTKVGEAAAAIPGENEGSALKELGEKARDIVEVVLERVQSAFRRSATPDANARPSPSPSPGP